MKPSQKTILIADDDQAILDSIRLLLEMSEYRVITTTGEDAILLINSQKPDIVLFDLWLGGISGKYLCQQLRADEKFVDLPIILVSASTEIKKTYKQYGATDFMEKPFDIDALIEKIENLTKS